VPTAPPRPLRAETLRSDAGFREAAALYTRVFGYDRPEFSLNPNLLSALARNGGSVVGVYTAEDDLIGFAYGFAGRDDHGSDFHYSQAAVVDPAHQGAGVGRLLKEHQREIARGWGHRAMRWTFDPLLARNAHFNFSSLGAEGIGVIPDYYDRPGTDRIMVEWALERAEDPFRELRRIAPPALGPADWGRVRTATIAGADGSEIEGSWLAVPAAAPAVSDDEEGRASDDHLRARVREALIALFDAGLVLVACTRIDRTTAAYLAVPRPEREETR
jgi:predicted GNAT superfamily acetyltransferase